MGQFGVDWFFLSSGDLTFVLIGFLKLFFIGILPFSFICCWLWGLLFFVYKKNDAADFCGDMAPVVLLPMVVVILVSGLGWWMMDWIRIASGSVEVDGSGVSIYVDM